MAVKDDLQDYVCQALVSLGGRGSPPADIFSNEK